MEPTPKIAVEFTDKYGASLSLNVQEDGSVVFFSANAFRADAEMQRMIGDILVARHERQREQELHNAYVKSASR